jgi:hypothetical protein
MTRDRIARYEQAVGNLPKPGYGLAFHSRSLGVATLGAKAGLSPERVFEDLCKAAQGGKRWEPDSQIANTVRRAFADYGNGFIPKPRAKPLIHSGETVLRKIIEKGKGATEADIVGASPVPIPDRPEDHAVLTLQALYPPDALPFVGERYDEGIIGDTIRSAGEWVGYLRGSGRPGPHIIPNQLTGLPAPRKDSQGMTYRGDACVAAYHFCVAEFDNLDRDSQLAFWAVAGLPVCALIDSGGKSLHAWLDVRKLAPVSTAEEWNRHIKDELYQRLLIPLGVDAACSNPARLSRLPGHYRAKGRWQRLLYLAPNGRRIFT